ncbi:MAG: TetR/AcrR family transcriptional regulator [Nakamurella sp.]
MTTTGNASARRGRPGHDVGAVVDAGIRIFTERGYDGATMDDIAAALGIAKSSVYHHVSGKEEILRRALNRALGALEAVFDHATDGAASTTGQLESVVRGSVATLVAELPSVTLLLRVRGNSDTQRAALARRRTLDVRLANLVIQAQSDGVIRADLDPHVVARLVFGTVNSLTEWYRPRADDHVGDQPDHHIGDKAAQTAGARDLADTVCAVIFDGLRVPALGAVVPNGPVPNGAVPNGAVPSVAS